MGAANDALTWRQVAAPDFGSAIQGISTAADLFGSAGKNALATLDTYNNALDRRASDALAAKLASYTDPAALRAAMGTDPTLGLDSGTAGRLHAADYATEAAKVTSLLGDAQTGAQTAGTLANTAATTQQTQIQGYNQGRAVDRNNRTDAARPQIAEYQRLAALDRGQANDYWNKNAGVFGSLDPDQQKALIDGTFSYDKDRSGLATEAQNRDLNMRQENRTQTTYQEQQDAYKAGLTAQPIVQRILSQSVDVESARANLYNSEEYKNANGLTRQAMIDGVNSRFNIYDYSGAGGVGAPSGSAGGASGSGGSSLSIPFAETSNYVNSIQSAAVRGGANLTSGSNKDKATALLPYLINQESGGKSNAVSSKGAQGITQIMPATAANPGFGMKPLNLATATDQQKKDFTVEYMTNLLNKYGGDTTKALAAYNGGTGNVDNWVKNQTGRATTQIAQDLIGQRVMQDNADGLTPQQFRSAQGDQRKLPEIVADARSTDFKNVPERTIALMINNIKDRAAQRGSPINDATAYALLQANRTQLNQRNGWKTDIPDLVTSMLGGESFKWLPNGATGSTPNLGGGYRLNDAGVERDLQRITSGDWSTQDASNTANADTQKSLQVAQQAVEAARSRLTVLQNYAINNPNLQNSPALLQAQRDLATAESTANGIAGLISKPALDRMKRDARGNPQAQPKTKQQAARMIALAAANPASYLAYGQ